MRTRYRAWMNGKSLDDIENSIIITDIEESEPRINISSFVMANGGKYYTGRKMEGIDVTITMEVHDTDIASRTRTIEKINGWAGERGILQINSREGRRLPVICSGYAAVRSALKWTETVEVKFSSTYCPHWEEAIEQTVSANGSTGGTINVNGTVGGSLVDAFITNNGSDLNMVQIWFGNTRLRLDGSPIMYSGDTMSIGHDEDGRLTAIVTHNGVGTSVLDKLARTSDDDLISQVGANYCHLTEGLYGTFTVRGRWR